MILPRVEALLHELIGLDAQTLGGSAVSHAVRQRMAACGLEDEEAYWARLTEAACERQELINAVIVPETWFFRDPRAFGALVERAETVRAQGRMVRLLSIPCSTGEEACSMVMALLDAGFAPGSFAVDAFDISTRNIVEAERGIYGRNSFRGTDIAYRARHFEEVAGGWRPREAVRRPIRYRAGNLFDAEAVAGELYDVVFCRNLLIYFDRARQAKALACLDARLAPDGLLVVGPAESGLPLQHGFVSLRRPLAFAFARRPAAPPQPSPPSLSPRPERIAPRPERIAPRVVPAPPPVRPAFSAPLVPPVPPSPAAPAAAPVPDAAAASLAAIERAANEGRLDEARQMGEAHLRQFGPSAGAYYLLGLALDAAGEARSAGENYRKALYLAPDHREALAQLALLLRRGGDAAGARALAARLERLDARHDPARSDPQ